MLAHGTDYDLICNCLWVNGRLSGDNDLIGGNELTDVSRFRGNLHLSWPVEQRTLDPGDPNLW